MGTVSTYVIPPTSPEVAEALKTRAVQAATGQEIPAIRLDHVLHGGMYSRTLHIPAGAWICGALIKVPTLVITQGDLLMGDTHLPGYHVLPAHAHRRQVFAAYADSKITMVFACDAATVAEAEREFTDEWELLIAGPLDTTTITGVTRCQEQLSEVHSPSAAP